MTYVQGFVTAVPAANKQAYIEHATKGAGLLKEFGVSRFVETWGDDVPAGTLTDFARAVQAKDDEVVLFSWFEYPSKEVCDSAGEKMMADPRMESMMSDMPFDAKRMIYAGFEPILDTGAAGGMGYVDGYLAAVPLANREAYLAMAEKAAIVFKDHGATRVVETWGTDLPDGEITDFKRAVQAQADEAVVYSWVEWPSKEVRVAGWEKIMADERMKNHDMPFDGKRMIYGGFAPILDE